MNARMPVETAANATSEERLASFAAGLALDDIPAAVRTRAEELMIDWFGSALAGRGVDPAVLEPRALGSSNPLAGGDSGASAAINRSVSFEVRVE